MIRSFALGCAWEPDFVLLSLDDRGPVVVRSGVFPDELVLREKLGHTLTETHGPVPRLNPELAIRIATALRKLAPAGGGARQLGAGAHAGTNRHPCLNRPRLDATATPEGVWIRVEHQLLFKLPQTGGVLFGIAFPILRCANCSPIRWRAPPCARRWNPCPTTPRLQRIDGGPAKNHRVAEGSAT